MTERGGWGALMKRSPKLVDTDLLPPEAAEEGKRLVAAAQAASGPGADSSRAPEGMSYTFTLEGDGGSRTFKLSDAALGPEAAALLDWFERHLGA